jgi:predicted Zn-dependent protease
MNTQRGSIIVIVLVIVAAFFGGYQLIGWGASTLAEHVPDAMEVSLFGDLARTQKGFRADAKTDREKAAGEIFAKLAKAQGLRKLNYRLYYTDDTSPNAFALPGGSIAVTRGLLDMVQGETGLAMVIGHEFGHHQKRHALSSMGRSLITAGLVMMFFGSDAGLLVGLAVNAAENSFSREQEFEADRVGIDLVHGAYGRLDGAFEFFEDLEKNPATKGDKALSFMSTHPYTPDRIKKLKARAKVLEAGGVKPKQTPRKKQDG